MDRRAVCLCGTIVKLRVKSPGSQASVLFFTLSLWIAEKAIDSSTPFKSVRLLSLLVMSPLKFVMSFFVFSLAYSVALERCSLDESPWKSTKHIFSVVRTLLQLLYLWRTTTHFRLLLVLLVSFPPYSTVCAITTMAMALTKALGDLILENLVLGPTMLLLLQIAERELFLAYFSKSREWCIKKILEGRSL